MFEQYPLHGFITPLPQQKSMHEGLEYAVLPFALKGTPDSILESRNRNGTIGWHSEAAL